MNNLVIAISSDTMGSGSEELGKILIKAYINTLTELESPPEAILFYNSGAHLTSTESNTIDDLKTLESKGTKILTCGTCINYYNLQQKPAVGKITTMTEISKTLATTPKVINI